MENANFSKALEFHKKNQLKKAIKIYLDLIDNPKVNKNQILFLLGTAFYQEKNFKNSIKYFKNLLEIEPNNFHAYSNMALSQKELNQIDQAIVSFKNSININPNFSHSYNNLGNLYLELTDYQNALLNFNEAIKIEKVPEFFFNRGRVYEKLGFFNEALKDVQAYLVKFPDSTKGLIFKINQLLNINKLDDCHLTLEQLSKCNVDNDILYDLYVKYYLACEVLQKAEEIIIKIKNNDARNFYLSTLYFKKSNIEAAINALNKIPSSMQNSNILNNYGLFYRELGDEKKSLEFFAKAQTNNPNNNYAKLNIGLLELKKYNFSDGWSNYYYRDKPIYNFSGNLKEWKENYPPNQKTFVLSEQGIGDQILFLSILSFINNKNLSFQVDKRLLKIFKLNFPNIDFYPDTNINKSNYMFYIFLGDLVKYFIKSKNDLIKTKPLFSKIPELNNFKKDTNKLNIGLSWKSPNSKSESAARTIDIEQIIKPLSHNNIIFHNLQYGKIEDEYKSIQNKFDVILVIQNFDYFNDLEKLLYVINQMDYVITTDNITAHLSGACGKKTFLLVPKNKSRIWFWHNELNHQWYKNTTIFFFDASTIKDIMQSIKQNLL